MVYLPATLASLTGSKSKQSSSSKRPKQPGGDEEAILIPREVAELCGHEMLVLRRQLRAGPARVVAEACSVSITVRRVSIGNKLSIYACIRTVSHPSQQ